MCVYIHTQSHVLGSVLLTLNRSCLPLNSAPWHSHTSALISHTHTDSEELRGTLGTEVVTHTHTDTHRQADRRQYHYSVRFLSVFRWMQADGTLLPARRRVGDVCGCDPLLTESLTCERRQENMTPPLQRGKEGRREKEGGERDIFEHNKRKMCLIHETKETFITTFFFISPTSSPPSFLHLSFINYWMF